MSENLSSESDRVLALSSEENDLLQRSNKKFKRQLDETNHTMELEAPQDFEPVRSKSYSQMTQSFGRAVNPLFESGAVEEDVISDDEIESESERDDENCPNIVLSKADKRRIRSPWKNSIIIKLFDKKMGYEVLMRRLRFKWQLKGNIVLTDVGHAFYVVRFTSLEDYEFVMTQGPWMIGDSYLTIRKWIPNFIADEAPMRHLTAWVRIPNLSVEYFDELILHKIGSKIGKVIKIDRNTESMDRGQYVRFCIEVDLAKPLLSKFRLNGRVWKIQYEGLKLICFKCGHLGHKEDKCESFKAPESNKDPQHVALNNMENGSNCERAPVVRPEVNNKYGEWMLVSKVSRKSNPKHLVTANKLMEGLKISKDSTDIPSEKYGEKMQKSLNTKANIGNMGNQVEKTSGSRFEILEMEDIVCNGGDKLVGEGPEVGNSEKEASIGLSQGTMAKKVNSECGMETNEAMNPNREGTTFLAAVSPIVSHIDLLKSVEEESRNISLEKISIVSKDKISEKSEIRHTIKNPKELSSKAQAIRGPKFKKGTGRKTATHRGVGKENKPSNFNLSKRIVSDSGRLPLSVTANGGSQQGKDSDYIGVPHSTSDRAVCGATDGRPVIDCGSSDGQSSANGDQLLHVTREQCALPDDQSGASIHNGWPNEGVEGDVYGNIA